MGYAQFVIWAGKQGFKYGQKYLNKAWQEATKGGKVVLESQFPKLVNKAKDLYKNFKTFDPKVVPKTKVAPKRDFIRKGNEDIKNISEGMKPKDGTVNLGDRIIKQMQKEGKKVTFDDLVRIYGKKPPGKADGGRIDKPLPTRSRDI